MIWVFLHIVENIEREREINVTFRHRSILKFLYVKVPHNEVWTNLFIINIYLTFKSLSLDDTDTYIYIVYNKYIY